MVRNTGLLLLARTREPVRGLALDFLALLLQDEEEELGDDEDEDVILSMWAQ